MINVRRSSIEDGQRLVEIWRSAVSVTHEFLTLTDRAAIEQEVQSFLPTAGVWLAVDRHDRGVGFMALSEGCIESLFVHEHWRGVGVGKRLVQLALARSKVVAVQVNEQNGQAIGFYRHLGFKVVSRSSLDQAGRAYPLLHMEHHPSVE